MSDSIYKDIRHLRASELRNRLAELGVDYNAEGATTKEELRRLLVKNLVNKAQADRKRKPRDVDRTESVNKRGRQTTLSREPGEKINPIELLNKAKAKKEPPGFLKDLSIKKTFVSKSKENGHNDKSKDRVNSRTSQIRDKDFNYKIVNPPEIPKDDPPVDYNSKDPGRRRTQSDDNFNIAPRRKTVSRARKQWNKPRQNTLQDLDQSRQEMIDIKTKVVKKETEIEKAKLEKLNQRSNDEKSNKRTEKDNKSESIDPVRPSRANKNSRANRLNSSDLDRIRPSISRNIRQSNIIPNRYEDPAIQDESIEDSPNNILLGGRPINSQTDSQDIISLPHQRPTTNSRPRTNNTDSMTFGESSVPNTAFFPQRHDITTPIRVEEPSNLINWQRQK